MTPRGFGSSRNGVNGRNVRNPSADQGGNNSRFNPRGGKKDLGNSSKVDAERVKVFGDLEYNGQQPYWDYGMTVGKQICHEFGVDATSMVQISVWGLHGGVTLGVDPTLVCFTSSQDSCEQVSDEKISGPGWKQVLDLRAEKATLEAKVAELQGVVADLRRVKSEEPSGGSDELADLLEKQTLRHRTTQEELVTVKKELERTKERLNAAGKKNVASEREIRSLTDRANHFKKLYESSMEEMKSKVQSFEDQRASNDAARESLEEKLKEVSHEHRLCQQKLRVAKAGIARWR